MIIISFDKRLLTSRKDVYQTEIVNRIMNIITLNCEFILISDTKTDLKKLRINHFQYYFAPVHPSLP